VAGGTWLYSVVACASVASCSLYTVSENPCNTQKHITFVIKVLQSDHIVHLKDGFCITLMHIFLLLILTAKDFNVPHGLVYHVYIHLAVHKQVM